jgi:Polysaccharide deacetylase
VRVRTGRARHQIWVFPVRVHTFHGVLASWDGTRLVDRLYVPRDVFASSIELSAKKYVGMQSCGPDDAALTVDDSTIAGAEACLIARQFGHEVTLFLNPHQIITQTPYFFTILNLAIDSLAARAHRSDPNVTWRSPKLRELRSQTRSRLMHLSGAALESELRQFLSVWDLEMPNIPEEHRPLDMVMLARLVAAGVQIGNHGWSHADISRFSEEGLWDDISQAQQWLRDATGQRVDLYAVPFGLATPPDTVLQRLGGLCLLVDTDRPVGKLSRGLVNRVDITDTIAAKPVEADPSPIGLPTTRSPRLTLKRRAALSAIVGLIAAGIVLVLLTFRHVPA